MTELFDNFFLYYRGRVALAELLRCFGVKKGDYVAIQAYTCSAVPEGVISTGAIPLYIDTIFNGLTMCPHDLEKKIKENPSVKVIVLQHTFGLPANITQVSLVAKKYGLHMIEDCCHTFNSEFEGVRVGNIADASFFSFEWGKPISIGLGGAIRTSNKAIQKKLKKQYMKFVYPPIYKEIQLILQKIAFSLLYKPSTYWILKKIFNYLSNRNIISGNHSESIFNLNFKEFNWKMSKFCKFLLNRSTQRLGNFEDVSKQVSNIYNQELLGFKNHKLVGNKNSKTIFVRYPMFVNDKDRVLRKASDSMIEVSSWYSSPVHPYTGDELTKIHYILGSCPNAEFAAKNVISLPVTHIPKKNYMEKVREVIGST